MIHSAKILKNTVIDAGNSRFNAFTLYSYLAAAYYVARNYAQMGKVLKISRYKADDKKALTDFGMIGIR
nr:hypothetical protein [uncultured Prevotella sp.]